MESSLAALEEPQEGADTDALERTFESKETAHAEARKRLERAERVAESRGGLPTVGGERVAAGLPGNESEDLEPESRSTGREPGEERNWATPRGATRHEPLYRRGDRDGVDDRHSPLMDVYRAYRGDPAARERIARNNREVGDWMVDAPGRFPTAAQGRALAQTLEHGGDMIPPVYLQEEWIKKPHPGRAVADSFNRREWIPNTNTLHIPKVKTALAVEVQTDGNVVQETEMETEQIEGKAQTIAGMQSTSQQLVDMSLPGIDLVIFDDLTRVFDAKLDTKAITGTVAGAKGLREVSGIGEQTWTAGTPHAYEALSKLQGAYNKVNTEIFAPPDVVAMHPRRWAFFLAGRDTSERPLVVPVGQPGYNAMALQDRVAAEAAVGQIGGIQVIIDPNIGTTYGAATNQDEIYAYRSEHIYLYQSVPVLRIFEEVLSSTLQVRFQLYGYYILIAGRLPGAIAKVAGTGLVEPSF